jgi:methionine sulfoxide reductase heme-binding subunit
MSSTTSHNQIKSNGLFGDSIKFVSVLATVGVLFLGILGILWLTQTPAGQPLVQSFRSLFATNSVQAWWYITRAAGLTSYFLLWLSMVWGLVLPTKFFHPFLDSHFSYDFHEFLSLLGLGFVALHVIVLLFDKFLPFSLLQILIPFTDSYRPFWVGLGILGFYLFLLVTVTFYMRKAIGPQAFRGIHALSLLGYLGATLHALFAGTDSAFPLTQFLYVGTFLIVLFLTVYWIVIGVLTKRELAEEKLRTKVQRSRRSS